MITSYEIRNINGKDVLYLYVSNKYEFSNEFSSEENNLKIISEDFININNIPFKGRDVFFIVNGIGAKKISIDSYSPDKYMVRIKDEENSHFEITLREYLLSILLSYYSDSLGTEILKAICVLYNTYAYKMMESNNSIDINNDFLTYKDYKEYDYLFSNFSIVLEKLNKIIDEVSLYYLVYNKQYILPFIHYSNDGKTSTNKLYPYLVSVNSLWDITSNNYIHVKDYSYDEISDILNVKILPSSKIYLTNKGHTLKINYKCFSIDELKKILKLPSNRISIIIDRDKLRFITKGMGNFLGLSLYGGSYMELNGSSFMQILNYYFPKCKLYKK